MIVVFYCECYLYVLMTKEVAHILICLLAICVHHFVTCMFHSYFCIMFGFFLMPFLIDLQDSIIHHGVKSFIKVCISYIFLYSVACIAFLLSRHSFSVNKRS